MTQQPQWKLFVYTCFGGCATGVSAAKALIRLWEQNPEDIKIACLPAVILPGKLKEMMKSSDKRMLVDGCALRCGAKLFRREGMPLDHYMELTSRLGVKKVNQLPSRDFEEQAFMLIQKEARDLLSTASTTNSNKVRPR